MKVTLIKVVNSKTIQLIDKEYQHRIAQWHALLVLIMWVERHEPAFLNSRSTA